MQTTTRPTPDAYRLATCKYAPHAMREGYGPSSPLCLPQDLIDRINARYDGKWRGVRDFRARIDARVCHLFESRRASELLTRDRWESKQASRRKDGLRRRAEWLAAQAAIYFDEHGSSRGGYRRTVGLDYVPPTAARAVPYCDMGGKGLGLVGVTNTTVYAKSSKWRPSSATEHYLVGRNEAGTYFSHRVPAEIRTVREAISWIWSGREQDIIARQGDIALIGGNGGPKYPANLPVGHRIEADGIHHDTHPTIRLPGKHERIIVGRRAGIRGKGAATESRD